MENDEAKAVQEVAKFGTKALDSSDKLGAFLSQVFGTLPADVIGVIGGDWLRHVRIRNAAKLFQRTQEIIDQRGLSGKTIPLSPSIALPLLEAAQDETRDELREMWARLLANGMDPERRNTLRQSIIETVKAFDPLDAVILEKMISTSENGISVSIPLSVATELNLSKDEMELSFVNLEKLGCVRKTGSSSDPNTMTQSIHFAINVLGREIIRATSLTE